MALTMWIVVADQRIARLLSMERVRGGRWRAEEREAMDSRWEDYHEHRRPSALGGRSASAHEHASPGFSEMETQEERRRFARDVGQWLEHDCGAVRDQDVAVFAAPGFFGILRDELEKRRLDRLRVHELELTRLRPDELAAHTGVQRALGI